MTEGKEKLGKRRFSIMLVKGFHEDLLKYENEVLIVATKGEPIEGYTSEDLAYMSEIEFQEVLNEETRV